MSETAEKIGSDKKGSASQDVDPKSTGHNRPTFVGVYWLTRSTHSTGCVPAHIALFTSYEYVKAPTAQMFGDGKVLMFHG